MRLFVVVLIGMCCSGCLQVRRYPKAAEWTDCRVIVESISGGLSDFEGNPQSYIRFRILAPLVWEGRIIEMQYSANRLDTVYIPGETYDVELRTGILAGGFVDYRRQVYRKPPEPTDIIVKDNMYVIGKMCEAPFEAASYVSIWVYRATLSPCLGACCRYEPSCSRYMEQSIKKYGMRRGVAQGWERLKHCTREYPGGCDPVK